MLAINGVNQQAGSGPRWVGANTQDWCSNSNECRARTWNWATVNARGIVDPDGAGNRMLEGYPSYTWYFDGASNGNGNARWTAMGTWDWSGGANYRCATLGPKGSGGALASPARRRAAAIAD